MQLRLSEPDSREPLQGELDAGQLRLQRKPLSGGGQCRNVKDQRLKSPNNPAQPSLPTTAKQSGSTTTFDSTFPNSNTTAPTAQAG